MIGGDVWIFMMVAADLCPLVDGGTSSCSMMLLKHRSVWSDDCHPASAGGLHGVFPSRGRHFKRNNIDLDAFHPIRPQRQHQCRLWLMLPGNFAGAIRFSVVGTVQRRKVYSHQVASQLEMLQDSTSHGIPFRGALRIRTLQRNYRGKGACSYIATHLWGRPPRAK